MSLLQCVTSRSGIPRTPHPFRVAPDAVEIPSGILGAPGYPVVLLSGTAPMPGGMRSYVVDMHNILFFKSGDFLKKATNDQQQLVPIIFLYFAHRMFSATQKI